MAGKIHNGMLTGELSDVRWWKSSYSNPSGNCVEIARLRDEGVAVRDSRCPDGPVLVCSTAAMRAFVAETKSGRPGEFRG